MVGAAGAVPLAAPGAAGTRPPRPLPAKTAYTGSWGVSWAWVAALALALVPDAAAGAACWVVVRATTSPRSVPSSSPSASQSYRWP